MRKRDDSKAIERRAKAMLVGKDIPPAKREVVRGLLNNASISREERYRAIIELVSSCPDKKVRMYDDERRASRPVGVKAHTRRPRAVETAPAAQPAHALYAPTETAYYLDEIYRTYRHLKVLRKRYLAHRNNRLGIGIRKRLIPHRRFLKLIEALTEAQARVLARLPEVLMEILRDRAVEDPTVFNLLRLVQRWLGSTPLRDQTWDAVKWMERAAFEREFQGWLRSFNAFRLMSAELRERLITEFEQRLRTLPDLAKGEEREPESDAQRREREKMNLDREREVFAVMTAVRFFLPGGADEDNPYRPFAPVAPIDTLAELLHLAAEALVFQRPLRQEEVAAYYRVEPPAVSAALWDFNEDFLKRVGKDAESRRTKQREALRGELAPYETLVAMLAYEDRGQNILLQAVEDQWRYADKKHYEPREVYAGNYFNFLDALVHYFKNAYLCLLDGTVITFRDRAREECVGSPFSFGYFEREITALNAIINEMHFFRSANPTLAVTRDEVMKILKGQGGSLAHVGRFIRTIGDCFYFIGRELHVLLDRHKQWMLAGSPLPDPSLVRQPLTVRAPDAAGSRPFPYYDCAVKEITGDPILQREIIDHYLVDDGAREGLLVRMIAFAYQTARECRNERLRADIDAREALIRRLDAAAE